MSLGRIDCDGTVLVEVLRTSRVVPINANIKLSSLITEVLGASGRRILKALIAGESDAGALAALGGPRLKCSRQELRDALEGRITSHHRFLVGQHLRMIEELEATVTAFDARIEAVLAPFRDAAERLMSLPGISDVAAQVILAEIGTDMSSFPTAGHLLSWAGLTPRLDESAGKRRSTRLKKGAPWLKPVLVRLCGGAGQEHLSPGPVPAPQSTTRTKKGCHRGRRIDPHRRLPYAARRYLLSRPRTGPLCSL